MRAYEEERIQQEWENHKKGKEGEDDQNTWSACMKLSNEIFQYS